jgi:hypothetical protein
MRRQKPRTRAILARSIGSGFSFHLHSADNGEPGYFTRPALRLPGRQHLVRLAVRQLAVQSVPLAYAVASCPQSETGGSFCSASCLDFFDATCFARELDGGRRRRVFSASGSLMPMER